MNPNHLAAKLMFGEEANYIPPIGSAYNFWVGNTSTSWNNSGNWSKNSIPNTGDITVFNEVGTNNMAKINVPSIDTYNLLLYDNYSGQIQSDFSSTNPSVNIANDFYVNNGGLQLIFCAQFNVTGNAYLYNPSPILMGSTFLAIRPNLKILGNLYTSGDRLGAPIDVFVNGSGNKTIQLNKNFANLNIGNTSGIITLHSTGTTATNFTLGSGTVNMNGANLVIQSGFYVAGHTGANFIGSGWNDVNLTVSGTLNLLGTSGNILNLQASSGWVLNALGPNNVSFVKAAYSNASSGNTIYAYNSINSGSNVNWWFYTFDDSQNSMPITVWNNVGGFLGENAPNTVGGLPVVDFGDYGVGGFGTDSDNKGKISLYVKGLPPSSTGEMLVTVFGGGSYSLSSGMPITLLGGYGGSLDETLGVSLINDTELLDRLYLTVVGEGLTPNMLPLSGGELVPLTVYNTVEGQDLPFFISGSDAISQDMYLTVKGEPQATGIMYCSIPYVSEDSNQVMPIYVRGF